jgi:hypothetical protein
MIGLPLFQPNFRPLAARLSFTATLWLLALPADTKTYQQNAHESLE